MTKAFDPQAKQRQMQNFVTLTLMYGSIISLFIYLSTCILTLLVGGLPGLKSFLTILPIVDQLHAVLNYHIFYWNWWLSRGLIKGLNIHDYLSPSIIKSLFVASDFLLVKMVTSILIPVSILLGLAYRFRKFISEYQPFKKEPSVHGDAHWATEKEIRKSGLRSKKGMLVGKDKRGYLISDGYQHALLFAPTGSGKGVGFVIPNLLFWDESVVCHDIKLENYQLTSGWRKQHLKQDVFVWEPANPDGITHAYNPLDWVSEKVGQMVDDVQKFSNLILQKKEFWENEARTLLVGIILYLIADDSKVKSFGEVVRQLRGDDFAYSIAVVLDTLGDKIHPVSYMNLAAFLQKADKERSGVVSTLNSGLELWANPIIDAATAKSDFNVQLFKKKPTTVYVGLTPDNIQRLKSLMSMFYQQSTDFLSKKIPQKDEPYGVLFIMDEFPTVGKLEQFLSGIAYFRGYHVRLFLVVQDTQQLKGTYEDSGMNSFLSNSMYRITFAANNMETAKLISELVGNQTVESSSLSKPKFFDFNPASRSVNVSGTQRALLLPQEVISLDRDDQIILVEASPPIRTKKIKYYQDKMFTSRLWKQIDLPKQEAKIYRRTPPQNKDASPSQQPEQPSDDLNPKYLLPDKNDASATSNDAQ